MKSAFLVILGSLMVSQASFATSIICVGANSYFEIDTAKSQVLNSSLELNSRGVPNKIYSAQKISNMKVDFLETYPAKTKYDIQLENNGTIVVMFTKGNPIGSGKYNGSLSGNEDVPLKNCSIQ